MLITLYFGYLNKKENEVVINQEEKMSNVDSLMVNMSSFNEKDMPLSEFLEGVVSCEMPALFMEEALKSGVVAARTFYLYNYTNNENYIPTSGGQCYITKEEVEATELWVMISYLAIYIGIIFLITSAAILALQQLCE